MKIQIYGCSHSAWPPIPDMKGNRYSEIIQNEFPNHKVYNHAKCGRSLRFAFEKYKNKNSYNDFVILQIPEPTRQHIDLNNNSIVNYNHPFSIHDIIVNKSSSFKTLNILLKINSYIEKEILLLKQFIEQTEINKNKYILLYYWGSYPGIAIMREFDRKYKLSIESLANDKKLNLICNNIINMDYFLENNCIRDPIPFGMHPNKLGHKIIAEHIIKLMKEKYDL